MSVDIDWSTLTPALEEQALAALREVVGKVSMPGDLLGPVDIQGLSFGDSPPHIEITDICDPLDAFYKDELCVSVDTKGNVTMPETFSVKAFLNVSSEPPPRIAAHSNQHHHHPQEHAEQQLPNGRKWPRTGAVGAGSLSASSSPACRKAPNHARPPHEPADADMAELWSRIPHTPSTTTPNRLRKESDLQMNVRLEYGGNARITVATQLQVNAPAPAFIALPVTLELTSLQLAGTAVFALCRRRACFCFMNPAFERQEMEHQRRASAGSSGGGNDVSGPVAEASAVRAGTWSSHASVASSVSSAASSSSLSPLRDLRMHSKVGDPEQHVLRNVDRIERFFRLQIQKVIAEFVTYPKFISLALPPAVADALDGF